MAYCITDDSNTLCEKKIMQRIVHKSHSRKQKLCRRAYEEKGVKSDRYWTEKVDNILQEKGDTETKAFRGGAVRGNAGSYKNAELGPRGATGCG